MNHQKSNTQGIVIFIRSDAIGHGDDELGRNLMMNFLHHLSLVENAANVVAS
jgi:hypothetical protein